MRTAKQTAEAAGSNPAPPSTGAYAGSYLLFLFSDSRERPARGGRNPATRGDGCACQRSSKRQRNAPFSEISEKIRDSRERPAIRNSTQVD